MQQTPHIEVEGLGAFADRAFLDGTLRDWTHSGGLVTPPNTVISTKAAAAGRALAATHGDVRARPDGSVSTPGAHFFASRAGILDAERMDAAAERVFDAVERDVARPGGEPLRVADAWVFRIDHWSDLLWANLQAIGPFLWSRLASPWSLAWSVVRCGSLRSERIAGGLVECGPGSFIHPNATVEFSVLGPGARVGAGAVVRGCVLGANAVVEELAMVEACVLGAGARIQRQAMAKYSVIEAGAAHAGVVQLGFLGAGAQVRQGATLFDQSLGDPVRVLRGGVLAATPGGMLGVCVGPGALIGQGVRIAAGRVVTAGLTILPDPDGIVVSSNVPAGTLRARVRNGRLEPLA